MFDGSDVSAFQRSVGEIFKPRRCDSLFLRALMCVLVDLRTLNGLERRFLRLLDYATMVPLDVFASVYELLVHPAVHHDCGLCSLCSWFDAVCDRV